MSFADPALYSLHMSGSGSGVSSRMGSIGTGSVRVFFVAWVKAVVSMMLDLVSVSASSL